MIKEVVVHDTVYVEQIEEIQKEFNAEQFEQGKADLNDDAKLALHDLAKVLTRNPKLKLSIEGHTSSEGDSIVNLKLSQDRAQARKVMPGAVMALGTVIWLLLANLITSPVVIFGVSFILNKK